MSASSELQQLDSEDDSDVEEDDSVSLLSSSAEVSHLDGTTTTFEEYDRSSASIAAAHRGEQVPVPMTSEASWSRLDSSAQSLAATMARWFHTLRALPNSNVRHCTCLAFSACPPHERRLGTYLRFASCQHCQFQRTQVQAPMVGRVRLAENV